jgi:predicted SnoaL-like aldol condensation-catalyzing enzyme
MTNKELVLKFYDEVFNRWDVSNIDTYMRDDYIQHNAAAETGKTGFLKFCEKFLSMKPHMEIKQILEDGDLVCVFFKCTMGVNGTENKVFDLYRIQDGKLAEHWDSVEHNIGKVVPAHANGLF